MSPRRTHIVARHRIRVYNDAQAGLAERERARINAVAEVGNRRIAADEQALHDRITELLRPAREAAQGTPWPDK